MAVRVSRTGDEVSGQNFVDDARSVVYHRRVVLLSEATMENLVTPKYFNLDWILECQARCQIHVTLEILLWTGPAPSERIDRRATVSSHPGPLVVKLVCNVQE